MESAKLFRGKLGCSPVLYMYVQDGKPEAVDVTGPGGGTVKGQTKEEAAAAKAASEGLSVRQGGGRCLSPAAAAAHRARNQACRCGPLRLPPRRRQNQLW